MNTVNTTHVAPQAENVQSVAFKESAPSQASTQRVLTAAPLRYGLLAGIVLLLTSLTLVALDSIRETEVEIETIHSILGSMPL